MNGQPLESPLGPPLGTSVVVFALLTAAVLWFVVAPILAGVPILGQVVVALAWILPLGTVAVVLAWILLNQTVPMLGIVLAMMPMQFSAVMLGYFYGLPHMLTISTAMNEIPLLLLTFILWRRNGLRLGTPDWFLLAFFTIALIRTAFGGGIRGFIIDDFGFLIPYAAGRVTALTDAQERLWAKCAVWIAAVLSAVGMVEVFILGDGPRRALYAVASPEEGLPDSFLANSFEGLREASTMVGPLVFAALCMVALIIWWVYVRNPVPAGIIFAGLVCTLTRSAWIGTAVAIPVLALRLSQKRRLANYALSGIIVFALAIPILGIRDFLFFTRTGQDESAQGHSASLLAGLEHVASHPFGSGAESVGPRTLQQNVVALHIENSYLLLAAQYGLFAGLCFVGFLLTAMHRVWKNRTPLGYVATAILIGFGIMMFFLPMHQDFPLNCWVWFPIGLAVRSATGQGVSNVSELPGTLGRERA